MWQPFPRAGVEIERAAAAETLGGGRGPNVVNRRSRTISIGEQRGNLEGPLLSAPFLAKDKTRRTGDEG